MTPVERATASARQLRSSLLAWFDVHHRKLPWRATKDPYAIWVSEVMLQQTQVDRVIGYWSKFLARFPTVKSLAAAQTADVLSMWTGLGYYSRARNLHRAAQAIVEHHAGEVPDALEALLELPGFGRYTAGAVASIAFSHEAPLVDGNVARVFSRALLIEGIPGDRAREAMLWEAAGVLVPGARPGDWNQALMELGATVCLPKNPLCLLCPWQSTCAALAAGRVNALPPPKKAAPRKRLELQIAVALKGTSILLARREEQGLFGGLWEMPDLTALGKGVEIGSEMAVIERTLTHRDLVLRLHRVRMPARLGKPPLGYLEWKWVEAAERPKLGMSSAMQAAIEHALANTP